MELQKLIDETADNTQHTRTLMFAKDKLEQAMAVLGREGHGKGTHIGDRVQCGIDLLRMEINAQMLNDPATFVGIISVNEAKHIKPWQAKAIADISKANRVFVWPRMGREQSYKDAVAGLNTFKKAHQAAVLMAKNNTQTIKDEVAGEK